MRARTGDIVVAKAHGLTGWLLKLRGYRYGHVGLALWDGQWWICEAAIPRVICRQMTTRDWAACDVYRPVGATLEQGCKAAHLAMEMEGQWYGVPTLLRLLWRRWLTHRYVPKGICVAVETKVCTELVRRCWREGAGIDLVPGVADGDIMPDMLADSPLVERVAG